MKKPERLKNIVLLFLFLGTAFNITYWAIAKYDVYTDLTAVGDAEFYIRMSQDEFESAKLPYAYRVLMPGIVSLLNKHFDPSPFLSRYYEDVDRKLVQLNFGIVNIVFLTLTAFLFHHFCRQLRFSEWESLAGSFLFFTSFFTVNYYTVPMVDSMACFFVLACIYAIWRGSLFWLSVCFLLGMLVKESTLVVVLIIFLDEKKEIIKRLSACLPGIVFYGLLMALFPVSSGVNIFTITSDPDRLLSSLRGGLSELNLYTLIETVQTYMFLWVLLLYGLFRVEIHPFIKKKLWLLILPFVVPFLVKAAAVSRVGFYLFPFVIPVALLSLRQIFNGLTHEKEAGER